MKLMFLSSPKAVGAPPVCLSVKWGPFGAGSLFSSVAPALGHATFAQGAVRYSAATVTLLNEIRARACVQTHGSRFKRFLRFGEFYPGFSSICWISSAFKSSAEEYLSWCVLSTCVCSRTMLWKKLVSNVSACPWNAGWSRLKVGDVTWGRKLWWM